MLVQDLVAAIESIAPPELAEEWDNVGLLIGAAKRALDGPVLLTIDLTRAVLAEANRHKCRAIVAYHPPLFQPIRRIADGPNSTAAERTLLDLVCSGIAVYSPHTALDAAAGGVTDWLADGLISRSETPVPSAERAGADRRALRPHTRVRATQAVKIVSFLPAESVETVRDAMASSGAGLIGKYELCSFAVTGTGSFRGGEGSNPAIGAPGSLEKVVEHRLEMVCSKRALPLALQMLRQFHPYEEPAIDVYELLGQPDRLIGAGRRLTLDQPATLGELAERLKEHLGVPAVQVAAAADRPVSKIGVVPGSGGSLAGEAAVNGCEVFVTGEMKHHEVNAALAAGMSVILGGHTATERGYLPELARRLEEKLPGASVIVSVEDRDPIRLV